MRQGEMAATSTTTSITKQGECRCHSKNLQPAKQSAANTRQVYSDIQTTYEEWIAKGVSIAYRWTWQARHTGQSPSLPIPPIDKEVTLRVCTVVHIGDGKVTEEFEHTDYLGFLQQSGVVPLLG